MDIIIGRNPSTRQLCVITEGTQRNYGQANSVPMDVSRHHLSMKPAGNGKWIAKNLNDKNVTFVNGISIVSKTVSESDIIELGNSHYLFPWSAIQASQVEIVDIRPLKKIWEEYNEKRIGYQIAERKFNVARSAVGIITMLAIACGFLFGHGPIYLIIYGIGITISVIFAIQAYNKCSEVPRLQQILQDNFDTMWVCPKCGRPLPAKNYTILSKLDACPFCKTIFKK